MTLADQGQDMIHDNLRQKQGRQGDHQFALFTYRCSDKVELELRMFCSTLNIFRFCSTLELLLDGTGPDPAIAVRRHLLEEVLDGQFLERIMFIPHQKLFSGWLAIAQLVDLFLGHDSGWLHLTKWK